jgi:hypothetical protein
VCCIHQLLGACTRRKHDQADNSNAPFDAKEIVAARQGGLDDRQATQSEDPRYLHAGQRHARQESHCRKALSRAWSQGMKQHMCTTCEGAVLTMCGIAPIGDRQVHLYRRLPPAHPAWCTSRSWCRRSLQGWNLGQGVDAQIKGTGHQRRTAGEQQQRKHSSTRTAAHAQQRGVKVMHNAGKHVSMGPGVTM